MQSSTTPPPTYSPPPAGVRDDSVTTGQPPAGNSPATTSHVASGLYPAQLRALGQRRTTFGWCGPARTWSREEESFLELRRGCTE